MDITLIQLPGIPERPGINVAGFTQTFTIRVASHRRVTDMHEHRLDSANILGQNRGDQ